MWNQRGGGGGRISWRQSILPLPSSKSSQAFARSIELICILHILLNHSRTANPKQANDVSLTRIIRVNSHWSGERRRCKRRVMFHCRIHISTFIPAPVFLCVCSCLCLFDVHASRCILGVGCPSHVPCTCLCGTSKYASKAKFFCLVHVSRHTTRLFHSACKVTRCLNVVYPTLLQCHRRWYFVCSFFYSFLVCWRSACTPGVWGCTAEGQ